MWQPIAWLVPPILKWYRRQLSATYGPREAGQLSLIIRTLQHKGHPHPVLSRSTSGKWRRHHHRPANRVRNATLSGSAPSVKIWFDGFLDRLQKATKERTWSRKDLGSHLFILHLIVSLSKHGLEVTLLCIMQR